MKDKNTNLAAVMQFASICSGEFSNKTIQELKEEVGRAKYCLVNDTLEKIREMIKHDQKISGEQAVALDKLRDYIIDEMKSRDLMFISR
jgi:hypothetical protein